MSKLRTIYMHLKNMNLLIDSQESPILTAQAYMSLSSKERKEHRQYCRKNNVKLPI